MGKVSKLHIKWLICGLYLAIIVEAASLGAFTHAAIADVIDHTNIKVEDRSSPAVIILTFLVIALLGHILTLPSLCIAVQRHSASALVPYIVWRAVLSVILVLIAVLQATGVSGRPFLFRSAFHGQEIPVFIIEMVLGLLFFSIALAAHRQFRFHKEEKLHTPDQFE